MKQKVVLFDIDYTLFDTSTFKQTNLKDFVLYGEVIDVLLELQKYAKLGIFSEGDIDFQEKKLRKTKIDRHFKKEHLHIVAKKSESIDSVLQKYKNTMVFLVDNNLDVLRAAKQEDSSIFTIWVKRKGLRIKRPLPDFKPDVEVKNLSSITKFIIHNS